MDEARVKIVATVGPASRSPAQLEALARAGADVLRVNGAHTPEGEIPIVVRDAQRVSRRVGRPFAVLLDLPGVKIRAGRIPGGPVDVADGATVRLVARPRDAARTEVPVPRAVLASLAVGTEVLMGDGVVVLRVLETGRDGARCRVEAGGTLRDRTGVHVRGAVHRGPSLTPLDLRLASLGARCGVDALGISFVRGAADVNRLRRHLLAAGLPVPLLVAKIERREAVAALDEVLDASDGVMVARGDLGLEFGPEEVPGLQKRILEAAARHGRVAITATQMLESMTTASRPTRAEASDVANAVFDRSDAVMLSGETAVGAHPALVVETMNRIVRAAEADAHCPYAGDARGPGPEADARRPDRLVVRAAVRLAQEARAAAVVVFTRAGHSARRLAKERPHAPVYAFAPDARVVRSLALSWGVRPRLLPAGRSTDAVLRAVLGRLRREEGLAKGDRVVVVMGTPEDPAGTTSLVILRTL